MSQTRLDIRTRVRDYLDESVADIWSDDQLNRYYLEELRSLPRKGVYLEKVYTDTTTANTRDYTLPTGTIKVELVERNDGSTSNPFWTELPGADTYNGVLTLPYSPGEGDEIRIHVKLSFTEITDDTTNLDVPDDKSEVLVWGTVVRAYKQLVGYYRNSKSWDSVTRPGDVSLSAVQAWLRDAKSEYQDLLRIYKFVSKPRDIDLTS